MPRSLKGLLHNLEDINYDYMKYGVDKEDKELIVPLVKKAIPAGTKDGEVSLLCNVCLAQVSITDNYCSNCGQKLREVC